MRAVQVVEGLHFEGPVSSVPTSGGRFDRAAQAVGFLGGDHVDGEHARDLDVTTPGHAL